MLVYFIAIILICLIALFCFSKNSNEKKRTIFLFLSFTILFLIMGFRDNSVGTDTQLYCSIFKNNYSIKEIIDILTSEDSSPLYTIYNYIIGLISHDCNLIKITNSFIICFLTALFIKNNTKHVFISTLLFLTFYHFFSAMNITRQYIAVMIVAYGFKYLKNQQLLKYLLCCLIATGIHNTAIISFVLAPLVVFKLTKKNIIIYLIVVAVIMISFEKIMNLFGTVFPHYDLYFNSNMLEEVGKNRKVIITIIYLCIQIVLTYLIFKKESILEKSNNERTVMILYIINFIAIIIGFISLKIMLLSRIEVYFSIFAIVTIPYVIYQFKDKILFSFLFVAIMFIPMYMQLQSNNSEVVPYKTWLVEGR